MVDYSVDETFDIHFTEHDDIAEVDGHEEFEDDVLVKFHFGLEDFIGGRKDTDTLQERASLLATRIAREHGLTDTISRISVSEVPERSDALAIEIIYGSVRNFEETL